MRARRSASRVAGFTLLEILVVVLIIGIVTAGMLLSMSFAGKDTDLQTESKRLLSLMDYAREQAELQTRDYGVYFGQHGYEFVVYDVRTGAWRRVSEDDALRERTLPSGLEFKLVVDARPIVLSDDMTVPSEPASNSTSSSQQPQGPAVHRNPGSNTDSGSDSSSDSNPDSGSGSDSDSDSGKSFAPQVMIFSSGELSSFNIKLERASAGRSITLDENRNGDIVAKPMVQGGT
ncbi:MAG TPA: type II secretion system minor pseudopilin GspH [Steroidobacteraceae bacterium]